ncbi:hypothetical protein JKP88DRAFT_347033 [Tribonema minus]|uniref:Uncharacterized protein n=1 Tax=Tribonema minus TaxID=303371 RepID=A0A836CAS7_9STRA|nr:hypothetical protein JKP88DRAFT_347033 [Tribonema minus]
MKLRLRLPKRRKRGGKERKERKEERQQPEKASSEQSPVVIAPSDVAVEHLGDAHVDGAGAASSRAFIGSLGTRHAGLGVGAVALCLLLALVILRRSRKAAITRGSQPQAQGQDSAPVKELAAPAALAQPEEDERVPLLKLDGALLHVISEESDEDVATPEPSSPVAAQWQTAPSAASGAAAVTVDHEQHALLAAAVAAAASTAAAAAVAEDLSNETAASLLAEESAEPVATEAETAHLVAAPEPSTPTPAVAAESDHVVAAARSLIAAVDADLPPPISLKKELSNDSYNSQFTSAPSSGPTSVRNHEPKLHTFAPAEDAAPAGDVVLAARSNGDAPVETDALMDVQPEGEPELPVEPAEESGEQQQQQRQQLPEQVAQQDTPQQQQQQPQQQVVVTVPPRLKEKPDTYIDFAEFFKATKGMTRSQILRVAAAQDSDSDGGDEDDDEGHTDNATDSYASIGGGGGGNGEDPLSMVSDWLSKKQGVTRARPRPIVQVGSPNSRRRAANALGVGSSSVGDAPLSAASSATGGGASSARGAFFRNRPDRTTPRGALLARRLNSATSLLRPAPRAHAAWKEVGEAEDASARASSRFAKSAAAIRKLGSAASKFRGSGASSSSAAAVAPNSVAEELFASSALGARRLQRRARTAGRPAAGAERGAEG